MHFRDIFYVCCLYCLISVSLFSDNSNDVSAVCHGIICFYCVNLDFFTRSFEFNDYVFFSKMFTKTKPTNDESINKHIKLISLIDEFN